jgi:hypothetical protein
MATSAARATNHDSACGGVAQLNEVAEMLDTLAAADVQPAIGDSEERCTASPRGGRATALGRRRPVDAVGAAAATAPRVGGGR